MAIIGGKIRTTQSLYEAAYQIRRHRQGQVQVFKDLYKQTMEFVLNTYVPDVLAVAPYYLDWGGIGGTTNFLSCGEFPTNEGDLGSRYLPAGAVSKPDIATPKAYDPTKLAEHRK